MGPFGNGSIHIDTRSCFNATQSTVLKGVQFGGVPVVLLLDFIMFLVRVCVFVCPGRGPVKVKLT